MLYLADLQWLSEGLTSACGDQGSAQIAVNLDFCSSKLVGAHTNMKSIHIHIFKNKAYEHLKNLTESALWGVLISLTTTIGPMPFQVDDLFLNCSCYVSSTIMWIRCKMKPLLPANTQKTKTGKLEMQFQCFSGCECCHRDSILMLLLKCTKLILDDQRTRLWLWSS